MASGGHDRLKSVAVAVVALVLTVLAVELAGAAGWIDYRSAVGFADGKRVSEIDDPYPARSTVEIEWRADLVSYYGLPTPAPRRFAVRTDRNGFRNPSDPERASVVVLGDSFVASPVPDAELFTALLAQRLGLTVANLGRPGFGPHQELQALRGVGFGLQPRIILWVFYEGNDLVDTVRYNGSAIKWTDRLFVASAKMRLAALVDGIFFGHPLKNYTWTDDGAAPFGSCQMRCGTPPCARIYFGNLIGPLSMLEGAGLARALALLGEAAAETQRHGVALVLIYAPSKLRVYQDICEFDEDNPAHRSVANDLPSRMASWASGHGVGFVDLTPFLHVRAAQGELVYFPDDTHWNALGNAVVADALGRQPVIVEALLPLK